MGIQAGLGGKELFFVVEVPDLPVVYVVPVIFVVLLTSVDVVDNSGVIPVVKATVDPCEGCRVV